MQNILIYSGPGAGPLSVVNTRKMLQQLTGDHYAIHEVNADTIKDPAWMDTTALLVMPGGADKPYVELLAGQGNANITAYVQNGGKYLGICAGAYYAADRIEFAKGDAYLEVTGERELKFFPGLIAGPTFGGYGRDVRFVAGMRAAKLLWQGDSVFDRDQAFTVYYNGGGSFVNPEKYSNAKVLAHFVPEHEDPDFSPAAIVECAYGNGKAILSGAHFEWDPLTLDVEVQKLPKMHGLFTENAENSRLTLAKHLLERLAITCLDFAIAPVACQSALRMVST